MKKLFHSIQKNSKYRHLVNEILVKKECYIQGLWGSSPAFFISSLAHNITTGNKRTILFITPKIEEAEEAYEDFKTFFTGEVIYFPVVDDIISQESQYDY